MKINYLLLFFCLSLLVTACVNPAVKKTSELKPSFETKPSSEPKPGNGAKLVPIKTMDASDFLSFAESYSNLPQDAQKLELASTNQALALNPNDLFNRMKLVMILGLPSSNFADTPKAQNLLQQLLQENILVNSQLAFAHIMFDYLIATNKSGKNDQKHDALLQKNENLQLKLEATQQKLDAAQTKLEAAQQKLDELKNIEKSMSGREPLPKIETVPKAEATPKK
jgi:hypothetical protein